MEENKNMEEVTEDIVEETVAEAEVSDETSGKKEYKGMTATKNGLVLRGVIGAFVSYYGYTILADISSTPADERMPLYIFIAVFGVAGIWIIIDTIKRLIKKEYDE